jgi:hypothetical protein
MSKQERLDYLTKTYPKDLEGTWSRYQITCKRAGQEPKPFLTDASLYDLVDTIGISEFLKTIVGFITTFLTFMKVPFWMPLVRQLKM